MGLPRPYSLATLGKGGVSHADSLAFQKRQNLAVLLSSSRRRIICWLHSGTQHQFRDILYGHTCQRLERTSTSWREASPRQAATPPSVTHGGTAFAG